MAYIFHEDELPKLVAVVPGRERTFFVNKELTNIDDMLAGVMVYKAHGSSPYHYHEICEHFYFIMEATAPWKPRRACAPWARATWSLFPRMPNIACVLPRPACSI